MQCRLEVAAELCGYWAVQFCRERYGMCMPDLFVLPPKQKLKTAVDNDIVRRVGMIQELIMDTVGNISLSDVFSARDISILIDFLCSY